MTRANPNAPSPRHGLVAITGTTGYIGRAAAVHFRDAGWGVIALSRTNPGIPGVRHIPWSLGKIISMSEVRPDVVVHLACASTTNPPGLWPARTDLKGLKTLLAQCRSIAGHQPRFIFVSSQSARPDAANLYGRVKHVQETYLSGDREIAVRPGLVYGGDDQGAFQLLVGVLSRFPVWPGLRTGAVHQPIHIDDLAEAIVRCASADQCSRQYSFGLQEPIDFPDLLRAIAHRSRRKPVILPLPRFVSALARRVGRFEGIARTAFGDRLNGLLNQRAMETGRSLNEFQLTLRRFGRVPSSPRYRRIQLAVTLLAYVGGTRPVVRLIGTGAVKRLARVFETEKLVCPQLSKSILYFPSLLRFAEPVAGSSLVFSRAINAATYVFDMTPLGIRHLRLQQSRNVATAVLAVAFTLLIESALLPMRMIASAFKDKPELPAQSDRHSPSP
jgi:nucleoside-diphosphate-sugar epimerase